jgi:hypothetical protein
VTRWWWLALGLLGACRAGGTEAALRQVLAEERQAHLDTDADLLASNLADTLVSIDAGAIDPEPRDRVRDQFRHYFAGARYLTWDDDRDPVVRVAPGGELAWVARRVRIARDEPALGGGTRRRALISAWTATYAWRAGRWQMTSVTSTFLPDSPADRILAGAQRAIGPAALDRLEGVRATAAASGPGTTFQVTVTSRRSGEARVDFSTGWGAGIGAHDRWTRTGDSTGPLSPAMETFLRGHEIHLTLLAPESRYPALAFGGRVRLDGREVLSLVGADALGGRVELYYAPDDTLPVGYRVLDQARPERGPVTLTVGDWEPRDGFRLFTTAQFRQGGEVFRYRFTEVQLDPPVADSLFDAP